jgi:hypothetical protein
MKALRPISGMIYTSKRNGREVVVDGIGDKSITFKVSGGDVVHWMDREMFIDRFEWTGRCIIENKLNELNR